MAAINTGKTDLTDSLEDLDYIEDGQEVSVSGSDSIVVEEKEVKKNENKDKKVIKSEKKNKINNKKNKESTKSENKKELGEYNFEEESIETEEITNIEDEVMNSVPSDIDKKLIDTVRNMKDNPKEDAKHSEEEVKESKGFLSKVIDFIKGKSYLKSSDKLSKKYKMPKKQIAKGFLSNILGTIGDVLDVFITGVEDVAYTIVEILCSLLAKGAALICRMAKYLARIITFNKTCTL